MEPGLVLSSEEESLPAEEPQTTNNSEQINEQDNFTKHELDKVNPGCGEGGRERSV